MSKNKIKKIIKIYNDKVKAKDLIYKIIVLNS